MDDTLNSIKEEKIDFIIELGDLCHPTDANRHLISELKELGVPCLFNVGNHYSDAYSVDTVLKFFEMKKSSYSFVYGNIKFIVLDANYIKTPDEIGMGNTWNGVSIEPSTSSLYIGYK